MKYYLAWIVIEQNTFFALILCNTSTTYLTALLWFTRQLRKCGAKIITMLTGVGGIEQTIGANIFNVYR